MLDENAYLTLATEWVPQFAWEAFWKMCGFSKRVGIALQPILSLKEWRLNCGFSQEESLTIATLVRFPTTLQGPSSSNQGSASMHIQDGPILHVLYQPSGFDCEALPVEKSMCGHVDELIATVGMIVRKRCMGVFCQQFTSKHNKSNKTTLKQSRVSP
jgi:hypothetical protein